MPWSLIANSTEPSSLAEEISNGVTDGILDFEFSGRCRGRMPVFMVTSLGHRWPRMGGSYIYQVESRTMIRKRRLKLDIAQQAIFNVDKRVVALEGNVGPGSGCNRLGWTFTCNKLKR